MAILRGSNTTQNVSSFKHNCKILGIKCVRHRSSRSQMFFKMAEKACICIKKRLQVAASVAKADQKTKRYYSTNNFAETKWRKETEVNIKFSWSIFWHEKSFSSYEKPIWKNCRAIVLRYLLEHITLFKGTIKAPMVHCELKTNMKT